MSNQKGQGLIQALIGISIMGIMALAFTSMMSSQQKQIKFLESKQDAVSIKNSLLRIFGQNPGYCPVALVSLNDVKFPVASTPSQISFNKIYESSTAEYLSIASGLRESSMFTVDSLRFENITGSGSSYIGDLVINLKQKDSSLMNIRPIIFSSIALQTQVFPSDPSNRVIIGCSATNIFTGIVPMDLKQKKCRATSETGGAVAVGPTVSCNVNEYAAGIYMVADGGGDADRASLLCCTAEESDFDGYFTQTSNSWTAYSGGAATIAKMCSPGYYVSGMECNWALAGDADQCRVRCSRVDDATMAAKFSHTSCQATYPSFSADTRSHNRCPAGTYGAGIVVDYSAPGDWDQASLMCCSLTK